MLSRFVQKTLVILSIALAFLAPVWAEKLKVATTFTIIADMAQNVAGEHAHVFSITQAGAEIHDYEPTPKDIAQVQDADLILWNGLELERWFAKFFTHVPHAESVVVSEGVQALPIQEGQYQNHPNPHAWMSPHNAKIYVRNIEKALSQKDPSHKDAYHANAEAYIAQITALETEMRARIAQIPPEKRWLVSSEGAFSYWTKDFGFQEAYLWPINAEQQGSPKQVAQLIRLIRKEHIPAVFSESTISDKPIKQVAAETGASYGGVLYVDSLSVADGPTPNYLALLRVTTNTILQALERESTSERK